MRNVLVIGAFQCFWLRQSWCVRYPNYRVSAIRLIAPCKAGLARLHRPTVNLNDKAILSNSWCKDACFAGGIRPLRRRTGSRRTGWPLAISEDGTKASSFAINLLLDI